MGVSMDKIDYLVELAKCPLFGQKKNTLLHSVPKDLRDSFLNKTNSEIRSVISSKKHFPNETVVTSFNAR